MSTSLTTSLQNPSDWSSGALPLGASGYSPVAWWSPEEAERMVVEHQRSYLLGRKSREVAEEEVLTYLRKNRIGIRNSAVSGWDDDSEMGSLIFGSKEQARFYAKLDDLRYDLRRSSKLVGIGLVSIGAGLGLWALAAIIRLMRGR